MDDLLAYIKDCFGELTDHRRLTYEIPLSEIAMAGYAIFSLKQPSLLAFMEDFMSREQNLKKVFGINRLAKDTSLREALDKVNTTELEAIIGSVFKEKMLNLVEDDYKVFGKYLAVSCDGTQHFCSSSQRCEYCLVKKSKKQGEEVYYHQMMVGVLVHPNKKEVLPIGCEPIVKQDGALKNDCELNANKRLLPKIRARIGSQKEIIFLFDALHGNGPQLEQLEDLGSEYIITLKNKSVQQQVSTALGNETLEQYTYKKAGKRMIIRYKTNLYLNESNKNKLVNYIECEEITEKTNKKTFIGKWITSLPITMLNLEELVGLARSRWKVENETFNTLKNQGYNLEHNYGHGKKYLATNFGVLAILAFLIDQFAQAKDEAFQKALQECKTRKALWYKVKAIFDIFPCKSMHIIYQIISKDIVPIIPEFNSE